MTPRCLEGQLQRCWCHSHREGKCGKKFMDEGYELVFRHVDFEGTVEPLGKHVQQKIWGLY